MRVFAIIAIICSFITINASEPYIYNPSSNLLYQQDDQPYDFVSLMIDAGYYNAPMDISSIIRNLTEEWHDGEFDYLIMPMYSVINYYIKDKTADDILLKVMNRPLILRYFDVPYIPANINDKALKMRMRFNNQFKDKVFIRFTAVRTSLDYQTINDVSSKYNYNSDTEENLPMINGLYSIEGIDDSIFFYDFDIEERFSIADAFMTYYFLQYADIEADIRFTPSEAVVISPQRIGSDCSVETFKSIKKDIASFIDNASYDVYFYSLFMPYLMYKNELNLMNGIADRMESMKLPEFRSILTRNPDCIFAPQNDSTDIIEMDIKKLSNNVTLIYRHRENSDSEISILIANKLKNEYYYSKTYASDIVINAVVDKRRKWTMMPLSALCDYALITGAFPHRDAEFEINEMLHNMVSGNIVYNRDIVSQIQLQSQIYADTIQYIQNYITHRIDGADDAMYLSDGELDVLRKKMMDGENIIIAVSTALSMGEIENIIMSNISSSSIYSVPYYKTPVLKLSEERFRRIDKWRISSDAFYFVAVLLNYPSSVYLNSAYAIIPVNIMENAYKYGNNLYFNMMQRSALTILPALSYYLFGEWDVLFNIIGIY